MRSEFNIRGQANKDSTSDFSIRGASSGTNGKVKELFPFKAGNQGKELFSDQMKNKGVQRRRAEDLF